MKRRRSKPCPDNRSHIFIVQVKDLPDYTFAEWLLEGHKGNDVNLHIGLLLESILAKRCACTQEDPEINQILTQNQAKQDDWPKEIPEEMPHISYSTTIGAWLPLWTQSVCLSTHISLSSLTNTLFVSLLFISIWKFISISWCGPGPGHWLLVHGGLVVSSAFSLLGPNFSLWPGTKILLQAT